MSLVVNYKAFSHQSSLVDLKQRRRTEDEDSTYFEYDLSSFNIRFEKCQFVKMFDDEMAENNEEYDTVLATKHFVVYKMCPKDECENCDGVHGEYVVDLDDFLEGVVKVEQEEFENMCDNCNEGCNNDGDYCSGCGQICWNWENLENNGYVDAADYIECQKIDIQNDDDAQQQQQQDDDDEKEYFIGPMCDNDKGIVIGLFSDENCWEPTFDIDVEDVLGYKLSYHVLSNVVKTEDGQQTCLSCLEQNDNNNGNADDDEVNEMCENIYTASGKCESPYGLENGFVNLNRQDNNFENQVENEFMTCTFINSLVWNSYTETGEINAIDEQDVVFREVSTLQTTTLFVLTATILGLASFTAYLYHKNEKIFAQTSSQGLVSLGNKYVV